MYNHSGNLMLHTALLLSVSNDLPMGTQSFDIHKNGVDTGAVCYGELGCYSIEPPWIAESRPVANYPEPPEKVSPNFCLYTRQNPKTCERLSHSNTSTITTSHLVPTHRVYIICHGFLENGGKKWIQVLTKKLLAKGDVNVIVVGWENGSSPPYTQAVANIRLVGTMTAFLVNNLNKHLGVKTEFIHAIGHSLGAHLSGYIGSVLKSKFNLRLGRISALDPAEPHFSQTDPAVRLDPSDAILVDVIHTDATPFIKGGLGMDEPVGHLDFYPNGGVNQPGCGHSMQKSIDKEDGSFIRGIRRFLGCDHVRSYEYFIESISDRCAFTAVECGSWEEFEAGKCFFCRTELNPQGFQCSQMGFNAVSSLQEIGAETGQILPSPDRSLVKMYTITNHQQPYCRSLFRVNITMSSSKESVEHGGEVGAFAIQIIGVTGKTDFIHLFKEQPYKPGSSHVQVVAGSRIGRIRSAMILWSHATTFNILTWRISVPTVHLGSVIIDSLEEDATAVLCPEDEVLTSGKEKNLRPCY